MKLHEQRPEVLYETIAARWRETFGPELVLAAQIVAARITTPAWTEKKAPARQERWRAGVKQAAKDPLVRLELLRNTDFAKDRATDLVTRLEDLAKWPADPLVAKWLVEAFARQTRAPVLEGQKCFRRAFTALEACLDRAGAASFKEWIGTHQARIGASPATVKFFDAGMQRVLEKSRERLEAAPFLAKQELDALREAGLLTAPAKPAAQLGLEALENEIYARPTDDAPRLVLADLLLQEQSPRGEFISLDFVRNRTPEQERARSALLKKHLKTFVPEGLLKVVRVTTLEFDRGFPVYATLKNERQVHPALATVRELDLTDLFVWRSLDEPCFAQLESVVGVSSKLAAVGPVQWAARFRRLGLIHDPDSGGVETLVPLLKKISGPALTALIIEPGDVRRIPWRTSLHRPDVLAGLHALVREIEQQLPGVRTLHLWDAFRYHRDDSGKLVLAEVRVVPWLKGIIAPNARAIAATETVQQGWRELIATGPVTMVAEGEIPAQLMSLLGDLPNRLGAFWPPVSAL